MRFFFYGTLMDETVRVAVLGASARTFVIDPARLDGWRRAPVRGRPYPIILPAAGGSVPGLLADGVDEPAAARLDRFEGPEYHRLRVEVRRAAGAAVSCWVYAASDAVVAGAGQWDFDEWSRRDHAAMLRRLAVDRN